MTALNDHDKKVIHRTCEAFGLQHSIDDSEDGDCFIDICGYAFSIEPKHWAEEVEFKSLRGTYPGCVGVDGWEITKWIDGEDYPAGKAGNVQQLISMLVQEAVYYRADCIDHEEAMAESLCVPDTNDNHRQEEP
jgi:hypothetical protein